jgi:uncharacterized repeat protein (TIGR01451 family)
MTSGLGYNYIIRVQNLGSGSTYDTTTVTDTLPAGVTLSGPIPTSANWTCGVV